MRKTPNLPAKGGPLCQNLSLHTSCYQSTLESEGCIDRVIKVVEQAQLYDKYGVDLLCQLVVSKLHLTLQSFKVYSSVVKGILEFVEYVHSRTRPG